MTHPPASMPDADTNSLATFLTVEQVKKRLNLKRSTAYNLVTSGEIPHIRLGRLIRVSRAALNEYIAEKLGEPPEQHDQITFWSVSDVADKICFGRSTAYAMVASGTIPSVTFGQTIRVPSHWLKAYLESRSCHMLYLK